MDVTETIVVVPYGLHGRSIVRELYDVVRLWGKYRQFLALVLPAGVVAALDALAAAMAVVSLIDPPGPG